jgi:hypothetical protein
MEFTLSFKTSWPCIFTTEFRATKTKKWLAIGCRPLQNSSRFASLWPARNSGSDYAVNELPQPQLRAALGF